MRVLVLTVVHHPGDARIFAREIRALLEAGHEVVYAAPFSGYGLSVDGLTAPGGETFEVPAGLRPIDLPRARGRNRLPALRAARNVVRRESAGADLLLIHDPELLAALAGMHRPPTVWDVHEDTAAAVSLKPYLPEPVRPVIAKAFLGFERFIEQRVHLTLAEAAYQERFARIHPFIPNTTPVPETVPPPDGRRLVYVGHNSRARGAFEIVAAARLLAADDVKVDVVGHADEAATAVLQQAHDEGVITWHGFVPNARALELTEGATAGLCLLHDEPNYRHSMITKIVEYMAHGVPIIATPLPLVRDAVERYEVGIVVPFNDAEAVAAAARTLLADDEQRHAMARRGHETAREKFSWEAGAVAFVGALESWARR